MTSNLIYALLVLFPTISSAVGPACTAASGAAIPTVIELYTSEGCDSCPPADRWLGSMKDHAAKGRAVPLAFHIDYWDYLGWKDPYADPAFGDRHREMASRGGAKVVYTPQILVDGREFQQWRRTAAGKLPVDAAPSRPARAELKVSASPNGRGQLAVTVAGKASPDRGAEAYVALFENDLSSDVKAGENRGVLLHHDFVVRTWLGPFAFARGALDITRTIDVPGATRLDHAGVAVIARDDNGAVIQALALPLRNCGS